MKKKIRLIDFRGGGVKGSWAKPVAFRNSHPSIRSPSREENNIKILIRPFETKKTKNGKRKFRPLSRPFSNLRITKGILRCRKNFLSFFMTPFWRRGHKNERLLFSYATKLRQFYFISPL